MKEHEIKQLFEDYACRKGYNLNKHPEFSSLFYDDERTEDAWRMFHVGFVKGYDMMYKEFLEQQVYDDDNPTYWGE